MEHELTITKINPMDASSAVYWVCSCGSASDEDFDTPAAASTHFHAVHA